MRKLEKVYGLVVHCSASGFGDAETIRGWHEQKGWSDIGYHNVILNGIRDYGDEYNPLLDGKIEPGRDQNLIGAQCQADDMNSVSLGVCLVGNPGWPPEGAAVETVLTKKPYATHQQIGMLIYWLAKMCLNYKLDPKGTFVHPRTHKRIPVITQHSDHDTGKPLCASLKISLLREEVAKELVNLKKNTR